ncbi:MAG: hypothetical protein EOO62_08015, partial [Hymenobacter sp.]
MTTHEQEYAKMARLVYRTLTDQRPQWEARSPAMVADFEQLNNFLQAYDEVAGRQGDKGGKEPADARDRAEQAAEAAAGRIVRGLRVLQLNLHNPALAEVAGYTPDVLNPLHGEELIGALNAIAAAADGASALLANEGVTAEHLQTLNDAIAAYEPLAGLNNSNVEKGSALNDTARRVVKGLHKVLRRLDTRIDNLRTDIPSLGQAYNDARASAETGDLNEGEKGTDGGIGRAAAGNAFGPEPGPDQQA